MSLGHGIFPFLCGSNSESQGGSREGKGRDVSTNLSGLLVYKNWKEDDESMILFTYI